MAEGILEENLQSILIFNVISSFAIFIMLVFYGVAKDYLFYQMYNIAENLVTQNIVGTWVPNMMITISTTLDVIPQYLDWFWVLMALTLFGELIAASYYAKRKGWFTSLGLLTFGTLFFMFITSIFIQVSVWFQSNFIENLFSNLIVATPFFNFYIQNIFLVNLVLIVICIVANVIDLDLSGFKNRKNREVVDDEVV